jgi:type II secretion system protein I
MRLLRESPCTPRRAGAQGRRGLTLLEVLCAVSIFLVALVAVTQLLNWGGDRALESNFRTQATLRCESKLAEVMAGIQTLSSTGWTPFSDNPDWSWRLDCQQGDIANLWNVQVWVQKKRPDGSMLELCLNQMVLAPAQRGSTQVDAATTASGTPNSSSQSATTSGVSGP